MTASLSIFSDLLFTYHHFIWRCIIRVTENVANYYYYYYHYHHHVLMAASMKMTAFSNGALRSVIEVDRHFRRAYCLHHHNHRPDDGGSTHLRNFGLHKKHHGALSQKADIFKIKHSSVRTIVPVILLLQIRDKCSVLDDIKTKLHHAYFQKNNIRKPLLTA